MYNGVQSTWHLIPYELRRESTRNFFWVNMKIWATVRSIGRILWLRNRSQRSFIRDYCWGFDLRQDYLGSQYSGPY